LIVYTPHSKIDKQRWNQCIEQSVNCLPYAFSWWLDVVSPGWDALIEDDYLTVMPLTHRHKLGFHYLYQPFFTQQLGMFSRDMPDAEKTGQFLGSIPTGYRYVDIQLNAMNDAGKSGWLYRLRQNYQLDLSRSYEEIYTCYRRNCRRNILHASNRGLCVKQGPGVAVFCRFVKRNLDQRIHNKSHQIYQQLQRIAEVTIMKGKGEIWGVYSAQGELLAAGWFVNTLRRCIFIVCASSDTGRKDQAMYWLVDRIIQQKAGSKEFLDFSGSDIPGVAYFNSGFGAERSLYTGIKRNRLPWPLRLLKP
jgi:hypothetical protein